MKPSIQPGKRVLSTPLGSGPTHQPHGGKGTNGNVNSSVGRQGVRGMGCSPVMAGGRHTPVGTDPFVPPLWELDSEPTTATPNSVVTAATSYADALCGSIRRDSLANSDCSIIVAVRVRPFTKRELEDHNTRAKRRTSRSSTNTISNIRPYSIPGCGAGESPSGEAQSFGNGGKTSGDGIREDDPVPTVDVEDDERTIVLLHPSNSSKAKATFHFDFVFSAFAPSFELVTEDALGFPSQPPVELENSGLDGEKGHFALSGEAGDGGTDEILKGHRAHSSKGVFVVQDVETPEQSQKAESEQEHIFEVIGLPLVDCAWDGYNACIFAYGQTSSGKTYTMMGNRKHRGLIPRVCHALFEKIAKEQVNAVDRDPERTSTCDGLTSTTVAASTMSASQPALLMSGLGLGVGQADERVAGRNGTTGPPSGNGEPDVSHLTLHSGSSSNGVALPPIPPLGVHALRTRGPPYPPHIPSSDTPSASTPSQGFVSNSPRTVVVSIAFMEIYNEQVRDLLSLPTCNSARSSKGKLNRLRQSQPSFHVPRGGGRWVDENSPNKSLKVRQHPRNGPFVEGLTTITVRTWDECLKLITQANRARAQSATEMNEQSSRSHVIFQLTVTQTETLGARVRGKDVSNHRVSKINLVDLAGSERSRMNTGSSECESGLGTTRGSIVKQQQQHFTETNSINQSLLTLRRVIDALVARKKNPKTVIPYRESLLTWILSDNFGGNSKTIMCATVSPHDANYQETESTLRYATVARGIVNRVRVNEDPSAKLIRALRQQLKQLQEEVSLKHQSSWRVKELQESIEENKCAVAELRRREEDMTRTLMESQRREDELLESLRHRERREEKWKREAARLRRQKEKLTAALTEMANDNPGLTNGEAGETWVRKVLHEYGTGEGQGNVNNAASNLNSSRGSNAMESSCEPNSWNEDQVLSLSTYTVGVPLPAADTGELIYDNMLITQGTCPSVAGTSAPPSVANTTAHDPRLSPRSAHELPTCSTTALPSGSRPPSPGPRKTLDDAITVVIEDAGDSVPDKAVCSDSTPGSTSSIVVNDGTDAKDLAKLPPPSARSIVMSSEMVTDDDENDDSYDSCKSTDDAVESGLNGNAGDSLGTDNNNKSRTKMPSRGRGGEAATKGLRLLSKDPTGGTPQSSSQARRTTNSRGGSLTPLYTSDPSAVAEKEQNKQQPLLPLPPPPPSVKESGVQTGRGLLGTERTKNMPLHLPAFGAQLTDFAKQVNNSTPRSERISSVNVKGDQLPRVPQSIVPPSLLGQPSSAPPAGSKGKSSRSTTKVLSLHPDSQIPGAQAVNFLRGGLRKLSLDSAAGATLPDIRQVTGTQPQSNGGTQACRPMKAGERAILPAPPVKVPPSALSVGVNTEGKLISNVREPTNLKRAT